jgi:hypothetical protein
MGKALAKNGVVDSADVVRADEVAVEKVAKLSGLSTEFVNVPFGG